MNTDLGIGLHPGDKHYRAFVGPPEDYDLVAAMTFGLLTSLGLRQHHALLDIGCGSLRAGRLFIPYLNPEGYTGIEPHRWLVDEGIAREIGDALVAIKQPRFYFSDDPPELAGRDGLFDFAVAQSIFSHTGADLLDRWLARTARWIKPTGALVATYIVGEDSDSSGWVYPGCVCFQTDTIRRAAARHGFEFQHLDWKHPRQTWALFSRPGFDRSWFEGRPLGWNTWLDHARKQP